MIADAWMSVLHFWLVFTIVATLSMEMVYCRGALDAPSVNRLARIDMIYGISAVLLIVVGFGRAMHGAKGWAFYSGNPVFWTKIGLFVLVGVLSIAPTMRILKWKKRVRAGGQIAAAEVAGVRKWLHFELVLLLPIVVAAAFMARGIGH